MFNPVSEVWFWFMIIGGLGLIAAIISYEILGGAANGSTSTPWWIWLLAVISFVLFFASFVLFCVWKGRYRHFIKQCECRELEAKGLSCPECDEYGEKVKTACEKLKEKKSCHPTLKVVAETAAPPPPVPAPTKSTVKPKKTKHVEVEIDIEPSGVVDRVVIENDMENDAGSESSDSDCPPVGD